MKEGHINQGNKRGQMSSGSQAIQSFRFTFDATAFFFFLSSLQYILHLYNKKKKKIHALCVQHVHSVTLVACAVSAYCGSSSLSLL